MSIITEICAKAREEGWRFEYMGGGIFAYKDENQSPSWTVIEINTPCCNDLNLKRYKLGEAIAAAMNGEEG